MPLRDQLRVMVVDDMSTSRGLIVQALDSFGIQNVTVVDSGQAALSVLSKTPAHLVVSDYHMPNMDGLNLLQHLRHNSNTRGVGFILVTGRAEPKVVDTGRALGMNNFLKKPFAPIDLRKCIEAVVGPL